MAVNIKDWYGNSGRIFKNINTLLQNVPNHNIMILIITISNNDNNNNNNNNNNDNDNNNINNHSKLQQNSQGTFSRPGSI